MSMEKNAGDYTLWVLCVDDETYDVLTTIGLPNVRLLQLSCLELDELKMIKGNRTLREYCWTLTPFAPRFVFEAETSVSRVTYVDADMWFRKNPEPILREFNISKKNVLITDHSYAPEYDQSASSGQYCVQFMTFSRNGGEVVRKWWEKKCVEWCYARKEDGKFGDQKYLDTWPEIFVEDVHVLTNKELILAPWNATRFPYGNACLWHFHSLRIISYKKVISVIFGDYPLPKSTRINIYKPYIEDIQKAIDLLLSHNIQVRSQSKPTSYDKIKKGLIGFYDQLWRVNLNYHCILNYKF